MTPMSELTHFNEQGRAKMVDVSDKAETVRTAIATSSILVNETVHSQITEGTNEKAMSSLSPKWLPSWQRKTRHRSSRCVIRFL